MNDPQKAEECRHAVLGYLAARSTVAQTVETIRHRLNATEWDFSLDEVRAAVTFLTSAELLAMHQDDLGSTKAFQITAKGTLQHERSAA